MAKPGSFATSIRTWKQYLIPLVPKGKLVVQATISIAKLLSFGSPQKKTLQQRVNKGHHVQVVGYGICRILCSIPLAVHFKAHQMWEQLKQVTTTPLLNVDAPIHIQGFQGF